MVLPVRSKAIAKGWRALKGNSCASVLKFFRTKINTRLFHCLFRAVETCTNMKLSGTVSLIFQ